MHAVAGGVGSVAVQLGKAAGALVICVVGRPEKVEVARTLGADGLVKALVSERLALDAVGDGLLRLAYGTTVGGVAFGS